MELKARVLRIVPIAEVMVTNGYGECLGVVQLRSKPLSQGDPEGEDRSMGERLNLMVPEFERQACQEWDPAQVAFGVPREVAQSATNGAGRVAEPAPVSVE